MKRIISIVVSIFCFSVCAFAQSTEYSKYLSKAKEYESKKQWAFALEAYYDAIGCDDEPSAKIDALNGYLALSEAIKSGNPGLGKYNAFSVHDEWKKLLIDAEKLGSSICKFALRLGKLEQGDLDYKTHPASYKSKVEIEISDRYAKTVAVVEEGYKAAYKSDWNDLPKPENWPFYSVSSAKNAVYDVGGAKILEVPSRWKNNPSDYYNAFAVFSVGFDYFKKYAGSLYVASRSLYDYKCNIVDENGNELVKGKRWLLSYGVGERKLTAEEIVFDGVTPAVMDLLDSGKAFINPVAVYLEYGKYNRDDDNGSRSFIKSFPEVQLDMSKSMIYCWNKAEDLNAIRFVDTFYEDITVPLTEAFVEMELNGKKFSVCKTEVTQALYEKIMGENPSNFKGRDLPVENVTWYDAIYFCNAVSRANGLEPVYAINGETDETKWESCDSSTFFPRDGSNERGYALFKDLLTVNPEANGYRLPTVEEWEYAFKGGENYRYSGSDNSDEVGWLSGWNSDHKTHPIAQKKPNGYGLYDMTGNVEEWCFDHYFSSGTVYGYARGDSYYDKSSNYTTVDTCSYTRGFRLVRSLQQ